MAITWPFLYNNNLFEDIDKILRYLEERNVAIKSDISSLINNKARRDNVVNYFMEASGLIKSEKTGRTSKYRMHEEGRKYLNLNEKYKQKKYLHTLLCRNVLHYSYFYDYILENELYEFSEVEIIEKVVLSSSYDFGVRIYDFKSAENVINLMVSLGVLKKDGDNYTVTKDYKAKFNETEFERLLVDKLKSEHPMITKDLCIYLLENEESFVNSKEPTTINMIYNQILRLNESKNILKFIPGLPRQPIPANHTMIELRGVINADY